MLVRCQPIYQMLSGRGFPGFVIEKDDELQIESGALKFLDASFPRTLLLPSLSLSLLAGVGNSVNPQN
jgi:hypothetical protein